MHFIPLYRTAEFVCLYKGFHSVSLIQIAQDFTNVLPSTHWGRFGWGAQYGDLPVLAEITKGLSSMSQTITHAIHKYDMGHWCTHKMRLSGQ